MMQWFLPAFICLCTVLWSAVLPLAAQNSSPHSASTPTAEQWQPHRNYARSWKRLRILTWNVENLFDTLHDEGCHDEEFLPISERKWTSPRYWRKQGAIARTLVAAAELQPIDLIGLCEVENDSVIHHLCRRTRLARLGYEYLISHSRDKRGVDVALLYQPVTMSLITHQSLRVPFDSLRERPTRDILHATFRAPRGDTIDVFIAHLIAMGDFNDEPSDPSIARVLSPYFYALTTHATPYPAIKTQEGNVSKTMSHKTPENDSTTAQRHTLDPYDNSAVSGTYFFRHQWSRIDQILVSHNFISQDCSPSSPLHASQHTKKILFFTRPSCDIHIFAPSFLLEYSKSGELHPRRTYLGTYYHGGISDHLPLFADFWY